jgi:hypothetical protein
VLQGHVCAQCGSHAGNPEVEVEEDTAPARAEPAKAKPSRRRKT